LEEIKNALKIHVNPKAIDYLTFVGEGEPTLCKSLGWLIEKVKKVWDIPIAIDTNSSLLYLEEVRQDLQLANIVMPSLDAGTEETFRKMNRPLNKIKLETAIAGLEQFRNEYDGQIWLEVMLVKGINDSETELKAIKSQINRIAPNKIHINIPIRPPAESWVKPPTKRSIELAQEILGDVDTIIDIEIGDFSLDGFPSPIEAIESIIRRHPMRKEQIFDVLKQFNGIDVSEVLFELLESGKVKVVDYNGKIFLVGVNKRSEVIRK
jgi:wyosine [tRNA(Phe)-imidazoG37] synthetase (radical SAM superfamily)